MLKQPGVKSLGLCILAFQDSPNLYKNMFKKEQKSSKIIKKVENDICPINVISLKFPQLQHRPQNDSHNCSLKLIKIYPAEVATLKKVLKRNLCPKMLVRKAMRSITQKVYIFQKGLVDLLGAKIIFTWSMVIKNQQSLTKKIN